MQQLTFFLKKKGSKDSDRERLGSSSGGLVIMEQTIDANNLFNSIEAQQYLNSGKNSCSPFHLFFLAWQDVIEQINSEKKPTGTNLYSILFCLHVSQ